MILVIIVNLLFSIISNILDNGQMLKFKDNQNQDNRILVVETRICISKNIIKEKIAAKQ